MDCKIASVDSLVTPNFYALRPCTMLRKKLIALVASVQYTVEHRLNVSEKRSESTYWFGSKQFCVKIVKSCPPYVIEKR
jgi:hypothetical protein